MFSGVIVWVWPNPDCRTAFSSFLVVGAVAVLVAFALVIALDVALADVVPLVVVVVVGGG